MESYPDLLASRPAWLYPGRVMHRRLVAPNYRFDYRYWVVLMDLARLAEMEQLTPLLRYNRPGLVSFHDRDHGPRDGTALRPWFHDLLRSRGLEPDDGPTWLLAQPRVAGVGFNPLSLWLCWHRDGRLLAALAEVRNTFGEWHGYLLHRDGADLGRAVHDRAVKCFHVSPFFPTEGEYRFRIRLQPDELAIGIRYARDAGPVLSAVQTGHRRPLATGSLLRELARPGPGSLGTLAAIHWEAAKIWLRGGRYHPRPSPPRSRVT